MSEIDEAFVAQSGVIPGKVPKGWYYRGEIDKTRLTGGHDTPTPRMKSDPGAKVIAKIRFVVKRKDPSLPPRAKTRS